MFIKILYILLAIAILLVLIMVHELGHYVAGKIFKFKINEFSIGFGKALFSKTTKSGEKFSIRLIPLGGYCAFEGEDEENENPGAFNNQKWWKRLIVLFSGVFFNFIFGLIISVIYLCIAVNGIPKIVSATPNNALLPGDVITAVNGKEIEVFRPYADMISDYGEGENITFTVIRDGQTIEVTTAKSYHDSYRYVGTPNNLKDKVYYKTGETYVLFNLDELTSYLYDADNLIEGLYKLNEDGTYSLFTAEEIFELGSIVESQEGTSLGIIFQYQAERYNFFEALLYAAPYCIYLCGLILGVLGGLFTGAYGIKDVGGTITAVKQIAEISTFGFDAILYLVVMLSMNLALFNILPIPALDGARMVFVAIEGIRKKPINRTVEGYIHFIGLIVLFALVIFLDVYHLFFMK